MGKKLNLIVCGRSDSDIVNTMKSCGYEFQLTGQIEFAFKTAKKGDGILFAADDYPIQSLEITAHQIDLIRQKELRVYAEYPKELFGCQISGPDVIIYERLVVSSQFFEDYLERNSLATLNSCYYLKTEAEHMHLCLAKVAGYDKLTYPLPNEKYPVLFPYKNNGNILVATSSLSRFIKARYAPYAVWRGIWNSILSFLCNEEVSISWNPLVTPSYQEKEGMPDDFEKQAFDKNINWFRNNVIYSANHSKVVIEGVESAIDYNGRQSMRNLVRADCLAESAMEFAFDWAINGNPDSKGIASKVLDYAFNPVTFYNDNPHSPTYGLVNFYENAKIFYGDDNARVILGALAVRSLLKEEKWDELILKCALANLRTSSKYGFRQYVIFESEFIKQKKNWTDFYQEDLIFCSPHYTAYLWAAYLWVYGLTGYRELLEKSRTAIGICMEQTIRKWNWQNSLSGEITRMLLPLAFLVRVDDKPQHRKWLSYIVDKVLEMMDESGAIQDMFGDLNYGKYPPPDSNEAYGTSEAPLIQQNGDKATDLLYTTNWAFIGLHEASLILNEEKVTAAVNKLAEFLCRIQVKAPGNEKLDGAWMRGFDYGKWEFYGSSADIGWGAWAIETGWTNAWIGSTLALRNQGRSLINLEGEERLSSTMSKISKEMFENKTDFSKWILSKDEQTKIPGVG